MFRSPIWLGNARRSLGVEPSIRRSVQKELGIISKEFITFLHYKEQKNPRAKEDMDQHEFS